MFTFFSFQQFIHCCSVGQTEFYKKYKIHTLEFIIAVNRIHHLNANKKHILMEWMPFQWLLLFLLLLGCDKSVSLYAEQDVSNEFRWFPIQNRITKILKIFFILQVKKIEVFKWTKYNLEFCELFLFFHLIFFPCLSCLVRIVCKGTRHSTKTSPDYRSDTGDDGWYALLCTAVLLIRPYACVCMCVCVPVG